MARWAETRCIHVPLGSVDQPHRTSGSIASLVDVRLDREGVLAPERYDGVKTWIVRRRKQLGSGFHLSREERYGS
jgi:hypothetical protein